MAVQEKRYTAEDFWAVANLAENADKCLQLIDGEIIEISPSFVPSMIAARIAHFFIEFLAKTDLGYITGADGGYRISKYDILIPDVGFISKARLPEMPEREVPVAPDLAVEVVSPTDSIKAVQRKAMKYLAAGTRMVWIVYPEDQTVDVCRPADNGMVVQEVGIDGALDGGELLPGFSLPIREIFPQT